MARLMGVMVWLIVGVAAHAEVPPVTVAIFNMVEDGQQERGTGATIAELLTVALSEQPAVVLVERAELAKVLNELALQESPLATRRELLAGRLVGADLILSGRVFTVGRRRSIVLKVTSVENEQIVGVSRRTLIDAPVDTLALELAAQLIARLEEHRARLLPSRIPFAERAAAVRPDHPLPALQLHLAGEALDEASRQSLTTTLEHALAAAGLAAPTAPSTRPLQVTCEITQLAAIRHRHCQEIELVLSLPAQADATAISARARQITIDDSGDDRAKALRNVVEQALLKLLPLTPPAVPPTH